MFDFENITFKYGEQELGFRVIEQAWKDANMPKDCYDRVKARCFLTGYPPEWKGSLFYWAALAELNPYYIMEESRKKWRPELLRRENGK